MKFTHVQITKHSLEVRNMEEPSHHVGDEWYHRTRPAEVADIVALLRGSEATRTAVLDALEGTDPRLPNMSGNRAACQNLRQSEISPEDQLRLMQSDNYNGPHSPGRS